MKEPLKRILAMTLAFAMVIGLSPAFEIKAEATSTTSQSYTYSANSDGSFATFWDAKREESKKNGTTIEIKIAKIDDKPIEIVTSGRLKLSENEKIILNLDGSTIKCNPSTSADEGQVFYMDSNANLTIKGGGTITGGNNQDSFWYNAYGGAFCVVDNARLIMENVTVSGNATDNYGGAIYAEDNAKVTLNNVTLTGNTSGVDGGAIYVEDKAQVELNSSVVSSNSCKRNGGAIYAINDAQVRIDGSIIGDTSPEDPYEKSGNTSSKDFGEIGAAIYCDGNVKLTINESYIRDNAASYGSVGGIYWASDGSFFLTHTEITGNNSYKMCGGVFADSSGSDIYLGGKVVIHGNYQRREFSLGASGDSSNLYLEDDDANINRTYALNEYSQIGITYGDIADDSDDCITGSGSGFEEADLKYFYYDLGDQSGNVIRKVDQGSGEGGNQWALFVSTAKDKNNEIPAFSAAAVNEAYASGVPAVINAEEHTLSLAVKSDYATKQFLRYAALGDFAGFSYAVSGSQLLGIDEINDFVANPTNTYTIKTPNGTFEYWTVSIVPEYGNWAADKGVAKVKYTENGSGQEQSFISFDEAWQFALGKPGSTFVLLADWLAGDKNMNGTIDPSEVAGKFGTQEDAYWDGALYVHQKDLTVDLNGHKIDRMGGGSVFYVAGDGKGNNGSEGKLTIMDSSADGTGVITGGKCTNGSGGAFFVRNSKLFIYGGTITGNYVSGGGGAIYAEFDSTVEIYGGTITGNTADGDAGAIYASQTHLKIYDGKITNNKAYKGGAIVGPLMSRIYVYGGEISGNEATIGGAAYLALTSHMTIEGGTISGNTAEKGGAIYLKDDGKGDVSTLTITGGNIVGNSANDGGAIFVDLGTDGWTGVTMSGGTISGNTAGSGGGVYMASGKIGMTGGTISGNTATRYGGGVYMSSGTVNMSGGSITGNKAEGSLLTMGGGVYASGGNFNFSSGTISKNSTAGHGGGIAAFNTVNFTMSGGSIMDNRGGQGGGVYWNTTGTAKLYGGSITGNSNGFWIARGDNVKVYLGGNIKIKTNGNTNVFLYSKNVDLYHDAEHPLVDGAEIGVYLNSGEYGDDNEDRISAANSGFLEKSYPYFFSDDSAYRIANREKGEWYTEADRWHLHLVKTGTAADERAVINAAYLKNLTGPSAGSITADRNTVDLRVHNADDNKQTLTKNSINGLANFAFKVDNSTIVGGEIEYDFVTNPSQTYMVKTPNGTYDYWTIRIIPDNPWAADPVIATVTVDGAETNFTSGNPTDSNPNKGFAAAWEFAKNNPGSTLMLHMDWLAGDTNNNGKIDTNETAGSFPDTIGGMLYMDAGQVTIDLNGYQINRMGGNGNVFSVSGGQLTITDSSAGKAGTITGGTVSAFSVYNGAGLILNSGTITKNSSNSKGGAICVYGNATVTINGGTITGNNAPDGGAILVDGNAGLIINGGTISNNEATGANENTGSGGAIYLLGNNATVTMNGGTITGNKAKVDGAGVYVLKGTFNFNGGTIEKNTVTVGNGGGVFVGGSGVLNFVGGYIRDNTANAGSGGGVYVIGTGRIRSTGGYIQNNTANSGWGGGVFIGKQSSNGSYSELKNTFVIGNSAKRGGGISFYQTDSCTLINAIENVVVHGNSATERGGGIEVDVSDEQHIDITGTNILENTAPNGAGIYYANGVLNLKNSAITGNIASAQGGGVFVNGANGEDIGLSGKTVIKDNLDADSKPNNLYLADNSNDIRLTGYLSEGSSIGISTGEDHNQDVLCETASGFRIDDSDYFHTDNSTVYNIATTDSGEGNNRYQLLIVKTAIETDSCPGISSAELKVDTFKALGGTQFAVIDKATRTLTLTVNNTYKHIFSNISFDDFVTITTEPAKDSEFADESILSTPQNFVAKPVIVCKIMEENDAGIDGYDGWYTLWTIKVVPEGGAWSDEIGNVAGVTYRGVTDYYYDMEMAYLDALTYAALPGGATLTLNQDWMPVNVGKGFDYDEGTNDGRLYFNDSNINLTIDLNGFTISRNLAGAPVEAVSDGQVFCIKKGMLTIKDSSVGQTGKITGANNNGKGGAVHMTGGHLILESGSITRSYAETGAAVYVEYSAKFTMNGGTLSGNQANGNGGAVFLDDSAVFVMNDGKISENYSWGGNGGGIYMEDTAVFTMNGGTIIKNNANDDSGNGNGGGIYASESGTGGVTVTMNSGEIRENYSRNNGGGIYWVSDGSSGKLYLNGGTITKNNVGNVGGGVFVDDDGNDPFVGGNIRIIDNIDVENGRAIQSNMYLEDDGSNLNQNTGNRLREGAMIGVRLGYNNNSDYFSAEDSNFGKDSVAYFFADDTDYIVRLEVSGTGGNANKLYLTRADESEATNSKAAIVGAFVNSSYATVFAPVFEHNVAKIPVDPDKYIEMSRGNESGKLSLNDVLSLTYSAGARIVDPRALEVKGDLTNGMPIQVKAADGNTVMTWTVKVVPGNEAGEWNRYTVDLSGAEFCAADAGNRYYPGEKVYLRPLDSDTKEFKDWKTVDLTDAPALDTNTEAEDDYSFTMPANNVTVSTEYYTVISNVVLTLSGAVEPNAAFPTGASYFANQTQQGVGKVNVVWKKEGTVQSGRFAYYTTYTAEVTIDLSKEADYHLASEDKMSATINGVAAVVERESDNVLKLSADFTTAKAKITKEITNYSASSDLVPDYKFDFTAALGANIVSELNEKHKTVPAVTEDPAVTSVNVTWLKAMDYNKPTGETPYVRVAGIVNSENNPHLNTFRTDGGSVTDGYVVFAKVYATSKEQVAAPTITIAHADGAETATVTITSLTEDAEIYYTLDGSEPTASSTPYNGAFQVDTPKGSTTAITVRAFAIEGNSLDSNLTAKTETVSVPYTVSVVDTNGHQLDATVNDSDGLFRGESAVITVTPADGFWISGMVAGESESSNSNSIAVNNIQSDVTVTVTCKKLVGNIALTLDTLEPGKNFPVLNHVGYGYTATINWNVSSETVDYGTTYHPTIRIAATGSSIPFASDLTVTLNGNAVSSKNNSTESVKVFSTDLSTRNSKLSAVTVPGKISIVQGGVLTMPQTVAIETEGNVHTAASVDWVCVSYDADPADETAPTTENVTFNADIPGIYKFAGSLVLPGRVEFADSVTGLEADKNFYVEVSVTALPKLPVPAASTHTQVVTQQIVVDPATGKTADGPTVRATVVKLSSTTPDAAIYYTMSYASNAENVVAPADPVVNGVNTSAEYDPATGIVLDTDGTYIIKAVVYKENYITSDVVTYTYEVEAPALHTVSVYNWIDNTYNLKKTFTAASGETVTLTAEDIAGKTFLGWTVNTQTGNILMSSSKTISFTMPNKTVSVDAVYLSCIDTINFEDISAPVAYMPFDTAGSAEVTLLFDGDDEGTAYDTASWSYVPVVWTDAEGKAVTGTAVYGTEYTGTITLHDDMSQSAVFADRVTVTGIPGATGIETSKQGNALTITFKVKPGLVKMNANYNVGTGNVLTVENGTLLDGENGVLKKLPKTLTIPTEAGMLPVEVNWACETEYVADPAQETSYVFAADLAAKLAALGIDSHTYTANAKITVKVAAPSVTFVAMPSVTTPAGSYDGTQTVELTAEAGAEIYYKVYTDTAPGTEELTTKYEGEITLEGVAGQTKTYVIRAAAKVGTGDSAVWSNVATYRYTITVPAATKSVTVENGIGGGNYVPGTHVTVKANVPAAGMLFDCWTVTGADIGAIDEQLKNQTLTFTMPTEAVTLTAIYKANAITAIHIRVTEPAAGSKLPATVSYDLKYADNSYSRNNSANITWTPGDATAERGEVYTMSVAFAAENRVFGNALAITLNGKSIETWDSDTKTVTYRHDKLEAAYVSHVNPAPITGIGAGTAFSALLPVDSSAQTEMVGETQTETERVTLPATVNVTSADGMITPIKVNWTVPDGQIGSNQTVTITGRLNADDLSAANITGGETKVVTVYVSSVAVLPVSDPTASPANTQHLDSVTVSLSCATGGATIYYTLDGNAPVDEKGQPTQYAIRYTAPIKLTATTTIKAAAVKSSMASSATVSFTYTVTPTYQLTVVNGSGSGKYKAGEKVTIKANEDADNYFIGWTVGTDTEIVSTEPTHDFEMRAQDITLIANYEPKVNKVELTVDAKMDQALPGKNDIAVIPDDVIITDVVWSELSSAGSTFYSASITIKADHGFAQHGDVYVNGNLVPSSLNGDGTVTLTYQTLIGRRENFVAHNFVSEPITGLSHGTDLSDLLGKELLAEAEIVTENGTKLTAAIRWNIEGCDDYDKSGTAAQTFTLEGEIILPAGVIGENPQISVEISVLAAPAAPEAPDTPYVPAIPNVPSKPEKDPYATELPFVDVPTTAYYYIPTCWALERGITTGVTEETFEPHASCTRAQMVTFLWRQAGQPEPRTTVNPFGDVHEDAYYYKAVLWAMEQGITTGVSEDSFNPDAPCSRGQMAAFLWRQAGQPVVSEQDGFTDVDAEEYYYHAVRWAAAKGITNGVTENTYAPDAVCTRGQMVTFLYRTEHKEG